MEDNNCKYYEQGCRNLVRIVSLGVCNRCYQALRAGRTPWLNNFKPRRGARVSNGKGYVLVYLPEHPMANGPYVLEHRLVMSEHIGRLLLPTETVHHKNGDRTDNRIENLELWSKAQPAGQSVQDKIEFALEILRLYCPEVLTSGSR